MAPMAGASWIRNESTLRVAATIIDLGNDQRDICLHSEGRRVVDDRGVPGSSLGLRRELLGEISGHSHQHHVAILRSLHCELLNDDLSELGPPHLVLVVQQVMRQLALITPMVLARGHM